MEDIETKRPLRVLVVDDNEANRALAQETLEDEGYLVLLARDGEEALAAMASSPAPDCVLLDVRMPKMDGFEVCERLRAMPQVGETPVIFLTALRDIDTFDRALRAGGDDFLTKPVRPTELVVRVKTALELRRTRNELHEHYELLRGQRDRLMRVQLLKERLMAFVVHDLKNPVNAMDLHAQLVLRDKTLSDDSRHSISQIRTEARSLTRMIMNLLDIAKADEGKLEARRIDVDLERLFSEVLSESEPFANAKKVALTSSLEVARLAADGDLLRRMLANLVENAIRHCPQDGKVAMSAATVGGAVEIRVRDTGPGIPRDMWEKVFDPFVQVEGGNASASPASRGGRGLGLAFCKLAAEAHGGAIAVEDGAPGAVFCLRLPFDLPS